MAAKVTHMELKVDLKCCKCYKKVKKVLCEFPQIQDQVYDEKKGTVKIKVVCCSPEKIRDKIRCKGGRSIESIEIIKPPEPPKPADKPKEKPPEPPKTEKPKEKPADPKPADKPKEKPAEAPKPADKPKEKPADKPKEKPADKPKEKPADPPKSADKPKEKPADPPKPDKPKVTFELPPPPTTTPAPGYPHPAGPVPVGFCCTDCYEGRGWGPCYNPCYGQPVIRYYDGYCGRPVYDSWGGGGGYKSYSGSRCSDYFSEENPQGCAIM